jgi:hypothetical protein
MRRSRIARVEDHCLAQEEFPVSVKSVIVKHSDIETNKYGEAWINRSSTTAMNTFFIVEI